MINVAEDKDYTLDRYTGYRNALEDAGLPVKPPLVLRAENSINGGYTAAKKLLKIKGLTAIFCASDVLALGAISGITDAGLTVPGSISIVGYDGLGIDLLSEPHITTIRQPVIEIGRVLANTIVDRICGKTGRTTGLIKPSLLPGKTVARRRG
jgi:LacI family transcriptional regulator